MRAVYRLNEEKLDFNSRVLSEREAVNNKTWLSLKEKKRKFQDVVRRVKAEYEQQQRHF